jgi:hypothetical protein
LETHCPVQFGSLPPLRFFDGVSLLRVSSLSREILRRWVKPALQVDEAVVWVSRTFKLSLGK